MFFKRLNVIYICLLLVLGLNGCINNNSSNLTETELNQIKQIANKTINSYKNMDLNNIEKLHWEKSYSKETFKEFSRLALIKRNQYLKYYRDIKLDKGKSSRPYIYYVPVDSASYSMILGALYLDKKQLSEDSSLPRNIKIVLYPIAIKKDKYFLVYVKDKDFWHLALHPNQCKPDDIVKSDLKRILLEGDKNE